MPIRVKGTVAGIEVVVSVQHQVGSVLVEQLPKGLSGLALCGEAVGSAERGLVPVGKGASGVVLLEILFQPFELGGEPCAAHVRTAARLCPALYIERDKVPRAQIVGVPAVPGGAEVPRLSILSRHGL